MSVSGGHTLRARLAEHPFLAGLDDRFLSALAETASERTYETDELLVRDGEPADRFLLIFHGKIAIEARAPDRPRLTIQTIGPGEVLGWSWFVPPHRWRFDARALKLTRAVLIDAGTLRRELESHPDVGFRFLQRLLPVIAERLENTRLQVLDIHGS